MDWQWIANGLFTIVGALLAIIVNATRESVKELKKAHSELADKVHEIDKLVAGNYVKRDELKDYMDKIRADLAKIFEKLEGKADKRNGA